MPRRRGAVPLAVLFAALGVWLACVPASARAASFTASSIHSPNTGAELFYDADTGAGSVAVTGTVTPALTTTGTLVCYSAPRTYTVAKGVPITAGTVSLTTSLAPIAGDVCRLEIIPLGGSASGSSLAAFTGPVVSVSLQSTLANGGAPVGYDLLAGNLDWSFEFGSLGSPWPTIGQGTLVDLIASCPIAASDSTSPSDYGSYSLFYGNACLSADSGMPPAQSSRSAIQIDGVNAYPPGALPAMTAVSGFQPVAYSATWDANHDTVTITERDALLACVPGGYPPTNVTCGTGLVPTGVEVNQTTTLLPGDQVARVTQTFTDTDGAAHRLDLLISQSAHAYAPGGAPGFEFPGETEFGTHAPPDAFSLFPAGPGSIRVIADAAQPPSITNPIGAITFNQAPEAATFVSSIDPSTSTFLMHYVESLPAGGSVTLAWSFSQASDLAGLSQLVAVESDRFYVPTVRLTNPAAGARSRRDSVTAAGIASDPEGPPAVTIDGRAVAVSPTGAFRGVVALRRGPNRIIVVATNLAGVTSTLVRTVDYVPPPCVVPRLAGRTLTSARRMLRAHSCLSGRVVRVRSRRFRRGRVVGTSPRAGSHRPNGSRVGIKLSAGAPRARKR